MKQKKLKILFLDIFTDNEKFRKEISHMLYDGGSYSDHVRKLFGLDKSQWLRLDASKGKFPIKALDVSAIVIGGSVKDPVEGQQDKWMMETYKFINKGIKKQLPILGICGGLQFVIRALGGEIILNPKGKEFGAITVGAPVKDTVKEVTAQGWVEKTVSREGLWLTQTPQAFRRPIIIAAYKKAAAEGFYGTDDASLVERMGVPVRMIPGDCNNIKVTTPEDLLLGDLIIRRSSDKRGG